MRTFQPTGHVQAPRRGGHAGTDFTVSPRLVKTKSTDVMHKKRKSFIGFDLKALKKSFISHTEQKLNLHCQSLGINRLCAPPYPGHL